MPEGRDVAAFDARAVSYDEGSLGRLHHEIAIRTADLALRAAPEPGRVLDVGCGTGHLLRLIADRCPGAARLDGIDPAGSMIEIATASAGDDRLHFTVGVAERQPYSERSFDLVLATTSFDHWADQEAGLRECARVLRPGGALVLVDLFSPWLVPTLLVGRRGKARTRRRATRLLETAGFRSVAWHGLYAVIINAATATV